MEIGSAILIAIFVAFVVGYGYWEHKQRQRLITAIPQFVPSLSQSEREVLKKDLKKMSLGQLRHTAIYFLQIKAQTEANCQRYVADANGSLKAKQGQEQTDLRSWKANKSGAGPSEPRQAMLDVTHEAAGTEQANEAMDHLIFGDGTVTEGEIPNGRGEFGLVPSNPIPCSFVGSHLYIASLRALDGTKVICRRTGSLSSDVSPHPIDAYEVANVSGQKLATIFISPYQKSISLKAPRGFKFG